VIGAELSLLRREPHLKWGALALLMLVAIAAWNGRMLLESRTADATLALQESRDTIEALAKQAGNGNPTATSPGAAAFGAVSATIVRHIATGESLAIGQTDLEANFQTLTARNPYASFAASAPDNALRLAVGNFDVAFVLVWLVPLLVIAAFFDIVAGERERGVLALAVVAGAAASRYLWTKWLTRTLASIVVTWLAVALAIGVGEPTWTGDTAIALLAWGTVLSAYVFFWAALALACNVGRGNSERHAAVLAAAWLTLVILLPAAINLIVSNVFPAPSRVELAAQLREATESADRAAAKDRDRWFFDHPDLRSGEAERVAYYRSVAASERVITAAITPQLSAFETRAAERRELTRRLQWLSPAATTHDALTVLSHTDGASQAAFRDAALQFHARWQAFFFERIDGDRALTHEDYARLPKFESPSTSSLLALQRAATNVIVLFCIGVLLCLYCGVRLVRLDAILPQEEGG
jgi:ABC-2 type transport system permease protein